MGAITDSTAVDHFISRWAASSGAERANFQLFAAELCDLLGVPKPDPAFEDGSLNDYTFERRVEFKEPDGRTSLGRIDLYKRNCFVMEAKQSREKGRPKALVLAGQPDLFVPDATVIAHAPGTSGGGERGASKTGRFRPGGAEPCRWRRGVVRWLGLRLSR